MDLTSSSGKFPGKAKQQIKLLVENENQYSRYICQLCTDIMTEPVQADCGCRFCLTCISTRFTVSEIQCPQCKESVIDRQRLMRDRAIEKEIMRLEIKCTNDECQKIMLFKQLTNHLLVCDFRQKQCNKCKEWYTITNEDDHVTVHCIKSMIVCDDCDVEMTREYFVGVHRNFSDKTDNICDKWRSECPYKCNNGTLDNVRTHLLICPNQPLKCPLVEMGCDVITSRDTLNTHMNEDSARHQILMMNEVQRLRTNNNELREAFIDAEEKMKLRYEQEIITNSKNQSEIFNLNTTIDRLKRQMISTVSELERYKRLLNVDQGQQSIDLVCDNSSATWTIRDIREKIRDAKSRSTECIVSDNFYVTRPGYNLALKVYLNGDGSARGSYLSVYFVIVYGIYDDEILWPFQANISLSLLSSNRSKEDITVNMRPDSNLACYGRPINRPNVGAGQPNFVELSEILNNDFLLHDGKLKLKIKIQ